MNEDEYNSLSRFIAECQMHDVIVPQCVWERLHFSKKENYRWPWIRCLDCARDFDAFALSLRLWDQTPPAIDFCIGKSRELKNWLRSRALFVIVQIELKEALAIGGYGFFTTHTESFQDSRGRFFEKSLKVIRSNNNDEYKWNLPLQERRIPYLIRQWFIDRDVTHDCDDCSEE